MPNTYSLISSNVLGSSAASVTFSSIPATFTDLVLRVSARSDDATLNVRHLDIQVNGSSANNYSFTAIFGNGSTATSDRGSSTNPWQIRNSVPTSLNTSNTFCDSELYLPNYTGSVNKVAGSFGVAENNSASTGVRIAATAHLRSVTDAVTSLVLATSGNFVSGSSFYLYGIKNS
jgi:hypothetical protein